MDWSVARRQSRIAILVSISKFAKGLVRQFWILIPLVLFGGDGARTETAFFLIFIFFGGFSLVLSIIGYFRFYYSIEDEDFVIRKGVLRKTEIILPIERIQSVNFQQGPIQQFFKVVGIEIDSAGASGKEFEISALKKEDAEELKTYLLSRRNALTKNIETTEGQEELVYEEEKELLFKHSAWDLFKIGVSQNHLQTAGILLVFFFGMYENISNLFFDDIFDFIEKVMGIDVENAFITILISIPLFLIVSFVITLFRTVINEFRLRFWKTESGFQLQGGLINRKETLALLRKIQMISMSANPIQRKMGLQAVRLRQAASAEVSARKSIRVAGVYEDQLDSILRHKYAALLDHEKDVAKPDRRMVFRRFLFFGVLPAIAAAAIAYFSDGSKGYYAVPALLPLVYWFQRAYYNRYEYSLSTDLLEINRGVVTHRKYILELFKIQCVQITQSPYQRRKSLANLDIFTASGNLTIPFLKMETAQRLHDLILYRVERSARKWM